MPGKKIGKVMNRGYAGSVSRTPDTIITAYVCKGDAIQFGDPVMLNDDNTVSKFTDTTGDAFIGFAVREVKQAFNLEGEAFYQEGDMVDVLIRGDISVKLASGAPAARGAVYARNDGATTGIPGDLVAAEVAGETTLLPGVVFTTREKDANNIVEVSVLSRRI